MYKWIRVNEVVRRLSDGANIPANPDNSDWKKVQEWIAAGNVPQAADPATSPPDYANIDNLDRTLKSMALMMRDYCNALKAGTYVNKSVADLKADFLAKYNSLPP